MFTILSRSIIILENRVTNSIITHFIMFSTSLFFLVENSYSPCRPTWNIIYSGKSYLISQALIVFLYIATTFCLFLKTYLPFYDWFIICLFFVSFYSVIMVSHQKNLMSFIFITTFSILGMTQCLVQCQ